MITITFYAYKGGTGRSLVLANVARYLSSYFGQRVFLMDFDLEAPGLHVKFGIKAPQSGLVDYLSHVQAYGMAPKSLEEYVVEIPQALRTSGGSIRLLAAGDAPSPAYSRKLGRLDWHNLFYGSRPIGVAAFLELQSQIESTYEPDFLLIDARTGITEIGGIATTILADTVVCLSLNNRENLEGVEMVVQSISEAQTEQNRAIRVIPVLSRVPESETRAEEMLIVERALAELADDASRELASGIRSLEDEILVLHSEPSLQVRETILVGAEDASDSLLLRDYLNLFSRMIPQAVLMPHVTSLVQSAQETMLDDPIGAQRDLETLARTTGHQEAWRALIKFYNLRNDLDDMAHAATALWAVKSGDPLDAELIMRSVALMVADPRGRAHLLRAGREFLIMAADLWLTQNDKDPVVGRNLINALRSAPNEPEGSATLIAQALNELSPSSDNAAQIVTEMLREGARDSAFRVALQYLSDYPDSQATVDAVARASIAAGAGAAQQVLSMPVFNKGASLISRLTLGRLLLVAGQPDAALEVAMTELQEAVSGNPSPLELEGIEELFERIGAGSQFQRIVQDRLGVERYNEIVGRRRDARRRRDYMTRTWA